MSSNFFITTKNSYLYDVSSEAKIAWFVDIMEDSRVITFQKNDFRLVPDEDRPCPGITVEVDELLEERGGEADRMTSSAPEGRCDDGGAGCQRLDDRRDRFGSDEWHVGKGDDPAVCSGSTGDPVREAGTHSLVGARERKDLQPFRAEERLERGVAGSNDREDPVDATPERPRRTDPDGCPVFEWGEELPSTEAGAGAGREENADDHERVLPGRSARRQRLARASQESRTVPGRMMVSSRRGPVERSVMGAPTASSSAET